MPGEVRCPNAGGPVEARPPAEGTESIRGAWTTFLDRWEWDWFVTLTFREHVHPERADKLFRVWISKINRELYGHRWYKRGDGVYWARALEYQKRKVLHLPCTRRRPTPV